MKKLLILILMLQIVSCAPVHFKNIELNYVSKYNGNLKKVTKDYTIYESDGTIGYHSKSIEDFDEQNNCVMLFEDYGQRQCRAEHIYENNLLKQVNYRFSDSEFKSLHNAYDKFGREISSKFCEDGFCFSNIKYYDKRGNIIKLESFRHGQLESTQIKTINYKTLIVTTETVVEPLTGFPGKYSDTVHYNKNGNIIKSESYNQNSGNVISNQYFYNNSNRLIESISSGWDFKNESHYKYHEDKKGNIIKLEHYRNGKLYELTTYDITYR